jgi:hypothetical protein
MKFFKLISYLTVFLLLACGDGILRGREEISKDGKTYLVIEDDNGGFCGPIKVDGIEWKYEIGQKGLISPGIHEIECGGRIKFEIKEQTIFYFDYWGP